MYLRGLRQVLDYIQKGGRLEDLLVGKIARKHVAVVRELMWRGVLIKPPLVPRYMKQPSVEQRLEGLRNGISVMDLIEGR